MASPRRAAVVALSVVLVGSVAACTPEAGPTPTPSPTFTCTANLGQCTPQQAEKEAKAKKDHAAAEASLRAGLAELYRIAGKGGSEDGTSELQRYFAEDELASAVQAMKKFKASKRIGHGASTIASVNFGTKYPKGQQVIDVCEDGTKFYTTDASGKNPTEHGVHQQYTATMKLVDERWKLTQSTEGVEVKTCEH